MKNTWINKNSILLFVLASILFSCEQNIEGTAQSNSEKLQWPDGELTAAEFASWVRSEENGFVRNKPINDITFSATYVPAEFKAIRELGHDANDISKRKEVAQNYMDLEFYELGITIPEFSDEALKYGVGDLTNYQERVQYYSFGAHRDALLICKGDTILCPVHTWERTFQAKNNITLGFAFPADKLKDNKDEPRELVFYDRIFGKGPLHFRF